MKYCFNLKGEAWKEKKSGEECRIDTLSSNENGKNSGKSRKTVGKIVCCKMVQELELNFY